MLSELFSCDPRPKCSPNDSHTLKEGGSGKPSTDKPNTISVAQAAAAKVEEQAQSAIGAVTGAVDSVTGAVDSVTGAVNTLSGAVDVATRTFRQPSA